MNFFKLYIGDYQRDTGTLTLAEHGAYMLMLQQLYATEMPLPVGRDLHRLLRADSKAERDAIDRVASKFWRETEDGLVNERALEEIRKGSHQREVNRAVGKRGGRPKKTESETESVPDLITESETELKTEPVIEEEPNRNPNQTPDTNNQITTPPAPPPVGSTPRRKPRTRLPDGFTPNDAGMALAAAKGLDVSAELQKFCDYHTAKGSVMADWQAAWRTWVGNAKPGIAAVGKAGAPAIGSDAYFEANRNATWWRDAGFDTVWDAANAQCWHTNAAQFREGKRMEVAV